MLVYKSSELRVRKSREGLVWTELSRVGIKMMIWVINLGVREMERLFEV